MFIKYNLVLNQQSNMDYIDEQVIVIINFENQILKKLLEQYKNYIKVFQFFKSQINLLSIINKLMEEEKRNTLRLLTSFKDLKIMKHEVPKNQLNKQSQTQQRRISKKNIVLKAYEQDGTIYENFAKIQRKKSPEDLFLIKKSLSSHFVFSALIEDKHIFQYLLDNFFCCQVKQGEFIMKQGDNATSFFVIQKGRFQVIINGEAKKQIKKEQGFGQLALLYSAPRSASLKALQNSILWGIDRSTFKKVVSDICQRQFSDSRKFIQDVKFFQYLSPQQKDAIASIIILQKYDKGQKIVNQGDPAASFYIIKSGKVRVICDHKQIGKLKVGESFGQSALLSENQMRKTSVEADTECSLLALGRDNVNKILGKGIHIIVFRNKIAQSLKKSCYLSQLSKVNIERIIDSLQLLKITSGVEFVKAGDSCRQRMFFILQGIAIKSTNNQKLQYHGVLYGEKSIPQQYCRQKYQFGIKFQKQGFIACIDYKTFCLAIGGVYQDILAKQKNSKTNMKKQKQAAETFKEQVSKLSLKNLFSIKKLGFGQFGTVYLVTTDYRQQLYALKCIQKTQIIQSKLQKHLQHEKKVLESVNHPFIIQCGRSFKDQNFIYFLTQFVNGMELFDVIRIIGLLNSKDSRFYIASLLLALQYFHKQNIIYRDLKPENVMVDKDGYLKLIDMGTCKLMNTKSILPKTFTIIGTPHYMAPQVLSGKGYSYYADLWSLGVCLYEFMCGYLPFGEDAQDPYQIYEQIIKKQLEFPNYINDKKGRILMQQLINKVPQPRLGGSFSALKTNSWFNGLQWDALLSKKMKAPFLIPNDKLVNKEELHLKQLKLKNIQDELKPLVVNKKIFRKDLDHEWDKIF